MIIVLSPLRSRFSLAFAFLLVLVGLSGAPRARAICIGESGAVAYVVFRAGTEGQVVARGFTLNDIVAKINELWGQGYYLYAIEGYAVGCEQDGLRYDAVFKPGTPEETWVLHWKRADFEAENSRLWGLGWRLTSIDTQRVNNVVTYNGIWRKSTADQIDRVGWKRADFIAENSRLRGLGWRINYIDAFTPDGTNVYYNAIFRKSTREQIDIFNLSHADLVAKYNELAPQGWRLLGVDGAAVNGTFRGNGIFIKSTVAERFWIGPNQSSEGEDLISKTNAMFNNGWRVYKLGLSS